MVNILLFWKHKKKLRGSILPKISPAHPLNKLLRLFLLLFIIILLHTVAMHYFEGMSFQDALWLSFTTMTTVGYGDMSASTPQGRVATILLMYILGIWLLAQLAGDFLDLRADRRDKMTRGLWRWIKMANHILIINTPSADRDRYLIRLIRQIKQTPGIDSLPIEIVTRDYPDGLPNELKQMGVVHYQFDISSRVHLQDLNVEKAKYVILLCPDAFDAASDSLTLDMLDRLKQYQCNPHIVAECVLDENRKRFQRLGADAVIRPVRGYPELIVRALSAPGTERVLENLFTHDGASTKRFDIEVSGKKWKDIACKLINAGLGTPLGFVTHDGQVVTNPPGEESIEAIALLVMVGEEIISTDAMREVISCTTLTVKKP